MWLQVRLTCSLQTAGVSFTNTLQCRLHCAGDVQCTRWHAAEARLNIRMHAETACTSASRK